jgi:hypothetical protein
VLPKTQNMFCTFYDYCALFSIILHFFEAQKAKHRIIKRAEYHLLVRQGIVRRFKKHIMHQRTDAARLQ